jgi:hypothetical protein
MPKRRGGSYREKFLTLTAPHLGVDVRRRIEIVFCAWPYFLRSLNAWAKRNAADRNIVGIEWLRCFEWEPGKDMLGHPHFHIWLFSPYIPRPEIVTWWREALRRTGCPVDRDPVVHIERSYGRNGGVNELIKYMTKDVVAGGRYVRPEAFAEVYKALDSRRTIQGSKGLLKRADRETRCADCGALHSLRVSIVRCPVERKRGFGFAVSMVSNERAGPFG